MIIYLNIMILQEQQSLPPVVRILQLGASYRIQPVDCQPPAGECQECQNEQNTSPLPWRRFFRHVEIAGLIHD